jgi:tRNA 2-thiouridine synthesizing protein A
VRNRDEFEKFRIEGRSPLPSVHVPYFEMLELGGKDEMQERVRPFAGRPAGRGSIPMSQPFDKLLDKRGQNCPMPLVNARKEIGTLEPGQVLQVVASDRGSVADFQSWAKIAKNVELMGGLEYGGVASFLTDSLKSRTSLFI